MLASELIALLEQSIKSDGDLQVGINNPEFASFDRADHVRVQSAIRDGSMSDDGPELGDKFVAIS